MKDKWVIEEQGYDYCIMWLLAEEQDLGAYFGDGDGPNGEMNATAPDSWDVSHNLACKELALIGLGHRPKERNRYWTFETRAEANQALKILNGCMKRAQDAKPWPEWAIKAQAAGWTAPKGWKP